MGSGISRGLVGYCKDYGFYFELNGGYWGIFKSDIIWLKFFKDY